MAESIKRTRNWNIIVYPESAPENWREYLDGLEWVESPLHDKDINPDGEAKKAHWHCLLMFGGVKTEKQVKEFLKPLNCPKPQICQNVKSSVRYMIHLDNPDKYQYNRMDIVAHGGVNLEDLLKPSSTERHAIIRDILRYCNDNNIETFNQLVNYAMEYRFNDWWSILVDGSAFIISTYFRSKNLMIDNRKELYTNDNYPDRIN